MKFIHYPVLYREVLAYLAPEKEGSLFFDGTLGEGGHSYEMLKHYSDLKLVGVDADEVMLERARGRLSAFQTRVQLFHAWNDQFLADYPKDFPRPDIMLFDLGISVYHYEKTGRGFSFLRDERLDMRLDPTQEQDAYYVVNSYSQEALQAIFSKWGEEKYSGRIARKLVEARSVSPIETSLQLADWVKKAVPAKSRYGKRDPATQVFQAIRIEVNQELSRLHSLLENAYRLLNPQGRLGVITFHSLEDRVVKNFFVAKHKINRRAYNKYAEVEEELDFAAELLTKKPLEPSELEIRENSPSRSAKLRIIRKLREEENG